MARYVIGVDGGGTKTSGVLATLEGVAVAAGETGSTNHYSNPMETVRKNLTDLISHLRQSAPDGRADVVAIGLGMAGVDRPEDHKLMSGVVKEILPGAIVRLDNDGVIALKGGAATGLGIIVISGTGSIALGMNGRGQRARAGGWGNVLGDEGSGYSIALKGLRAVCRAHDGRSSETGLTKLVTDQLGTEDAAGILGWIKSHNGAKDQIAALSRLVFEAAKVGDETAHRILREEAEELAIAAAAVGAKLFPSESEGYEVVVAGGNLRHSAEFFDMFQAAVAEHLPHVSVVQPRREPVDGAVLLALQDVTKG